MSFDNKSSNRLATSNSGVLGWHAAAWQSIVGEKSRWPHAVLLKGERGIGKLAFAQELAKGLLCERSETLKSCGDCTGCNLIAAALHPDFRDVVPAAASPEIDEIALDRARDKAKKPSALILIEQIRELTDYVNIRSQRDVGKVIALYPAESLNVNAANALLKMLEEPPPRTYFLLITHGAQKLLPTLLSRCRQIALPAPDRQQALGWLAAHGIRQPELSLAQAGGAPLQAAGFDADYWVQRASLLAHLTAPRFDPLATAEALRRHEMVCTVDWLQKWVFDLIFLKVVGKIRYYPDCGEVLSKLVNGLDSREMIRFSKELSDQREVAGHSLNAQLFTEQLMLSYSHLLRSGRNG
ncbi:MAG: DNA polymerase III subunit delta' [Pseudomonadota bacterium]|nr:DNA polymerase III subunit delta' [Pseudomonadota bacterium]